MNILHVNKFHYEKGGSEAVYFRTADILSAQGHNSYFFSMVHPNNVPCCTDNYFVSHIDLNSTLSIQQQIRTVARILYSTEARQNISSLLDEYKIDVVHLHNIHHQISPSILMEINKRRLPVVMTLHDYKMSCASYSMYVNGAPCEACKNGRYVNILKKKCVKGSHIKSLLSLVEMVLHHSVLDIYGKIDVFIAPSIFLKSKLHEMGFNKNIRYLPNFIDISQITASSAKIIKDNSICYFGRLSDGKGLLTLLAAAKLNKSVQFKIIGTGPLEADLIRVIAQDNLQNVKMLGYLKGEQLFTQIAASCAVVLPSECYENNPISVLETFALEMPVIGARIGGIPELDKDGETGFTFIPGDAVDLGEKIRTLIANSALATQMGKNARAVVLDQFSAEKYCQKLMNIYEMAIETSKRRFTER